MSISLVDSWEIRVTYSTVFLFVFDMDQTPESTKLNQLRRVLELSNRTTPAERNSDVEWKTPSKGGYPENSPRSHAMKWLKSEEALLTSSVEVTNNIVKTLLLLFLFLSPTDRVAHARIRRAA